MANPFAEVIGEFKKAPPAGKALAVVAVLTVAGIGLYVAKTKAGSTTTGTTTSGASVLPVDPSLTGGVSGVPFPNLTSPVAGGISVPAAPAYQTQTILPAGVNSKLSNNFSVYTTKGGETIGSLNSLANWTGTGNNVQFYRNNNDILRNIGYLDSSGNVINSAASLPAGIKLSI